MFTKRGCSLYISIKNHNNQAITSRCMYLQCFDIFNQIANSSFSNMIYCKAIKCHLYYQKIYQQRYQARTPHHFLKSCFRITYTIIIYLDRIVLNEAALVNQDSSRFLLVIYIGFIIILRQLTSQLTTGLTLIYSQQLQLQFTNLCFSQVTQLAITNQHKLCSIYRFYKVISMYVMN